MLGEHGKEFLDVAEYLLSGGDRGEAYLRSTISRAYYAVFNYLSFVLRQGCVQLPRTGTAHFKLPQCLQNSRNLGLHLIAPKITSLHLERKKADYEIGRSINRSKAQDAIQEANRIIDQFDRCLDELDSDDKRRIFDKMKRYLRENPS